MELKTKYDTGDFHCGVGHDYRTTVKDYKVL